MKLDGKKLFHLVFSSYCKHNVSGSITFVIASLSPHEITSLIQSAKEFEIFHLASKCDSGKPYESCSRLSVTKNS